MASWCTWALSSIFFAGFLASDAFGVVLVYRTLEERPQGTFIGNVARDSRLKNSMSNSEFRRLRYSFLTQDKPHSKFFRIQEDTGQMYTVTALDRELICDSSILSCSAELAVAVLSTSGEFFQVFPVRVIVDDFNDNSPRFPRKEIYLQIPESAEPGSVFVIQGATDNDAGNNSVQAYGIYPPDGVFGLKTVRNLEGVMDIGIVVREQLDRERTDSYKLTIYAKDGGNPVRTGSAVVNISITDSNDHYPTFSSSMFNFSLVENTAVGTTILRLRARDLDQGKNAEVVYHFNKRSSKAVLKTFALNSSTGALILKSRLDFETIKRYQFAVEASDRGEQPRTSQCIVVVNVFDVNDESPVIKFNMFASGNHAELPENATPGKFIAHMSVIDRDSGENGEVVCQLDNNLVRLQRLYDKDFKIILNTELDREVQDTYHIVVLCQDGGYPALRGAATLTIRVRDINDNPPVFSQAVYKAKVLEDKDIGMSVTTVTATDADDGENARLFYAIHGNTDSHYFSIASDSGLIRIAKKIDREKITEVQLLVIARDNGSPSQLYAQATVIITVLDVNDESPKFNSTHYILRIAEFNQTNITVGSVFAEDPDLGSGGEVIYSIVPSSDPGNMFSISPVNGSISTTRVLDRELQDTYHFVIMAKDKGANPHSSTVNVTVYVKDLNDNFPIVTQPAGDNNTFEILHTSPVNYRITRVTAYDMDSDENAELSFYIEGGNEFGIFKIDQISGEINVAKWIDKSQADSIHALVIVVKDHGDPQRSAVKNVQVAIILNNSTSEFLQDSSFRHGTNFIIIISVVIATMIASVVIVIAICCVRKRDNRRHTTNYLVKPEEPDILKNKDVESAVEPGTKVLPMEKESIPPLDPSKETRKEVSFSLKNKDASPTNTFSTFKGQKGNRGSQTQPPFSLYVDMTYRRKDDTHSNTSSETFTSDSGRGGSDEEFPRMQQATYDRANPRMMFARNTTCALADPSQESISQRPFVPNTLDYNTHRLDKSGVLETDIVSDSDIMEMLLMQDALMYGRNGVMNNGKLSNSKRDYLAMRNLKSEHDRAGNYRTEPTNVRRDGGNCVEGEGSNLRGYSSLEHCAPYGGGGVDGGTVGEYLYSEGPTPVPKIRDSVYYFEKNFPDLLKHKQNSGNNGSAPRCARDGYPVLERGSVSTAGSNNGHSRDGDGDTTTSGSYCVSPANSSAEVTVLGHDTLKDAFV